MNKQLLNYCGQNCLILGSSGEIGRYLIDFCKNNGLVVATLDPAKEEDLNKGKFKSGDEKSAQKAFDRIMDTLGDVDFILCAYNFEDFRNVIEGNDMNPGMWAELLRDWGLNQFLILRAAVKRFNDGKKRRIVYFHSTRGYTGEGEGEGHLSPGGSVHEAACSGGITGMMTSIARSIIPLGWSVNGIAFDELSETSAPKIKWGLHLWLSGMGEYSCGETFRVYES